MTEVELGLEIKISFGGANNSSWAAHALFSCTVSYDFDYPFRNTDFSSLSEFDVQSLSKIHLWHTWSVSIRYIPWHKAYNLGDQKCPWRPEVLLTLLRSTSNQFRYKRANLKLKCTLKGTIFSANSNNREGCHDLAIWWHHRMTEIRWSGLERHF